MSISKRVTLWLCGVIATITVLLVIVMTLSTRSEIRASLDSEVEARGSAVRELLTLTDRVMMSRVDASLSTLEHLIAEQGALTPGASTRVGASSVPDLMLGGQSLANSTQLMDLHLALQGGTATLFSRQGNDFISITTNVLDQQGNRAIGTRLDPATEAYTLVKTGQTYRGQVNILGSSYLTAYKPIMDGSGQAIGVLYVGYRADMESLQDYIQRARILNDGFVALQDDQGVLRMHSAHVSNAEVERILSTNSSDWDVHTQTFNRWGYNIFLVASHAEVVATANRQSLAVAITVILVGGILLLVVIFLVRKVVLQRLSAMNEMIRRIVEEEGDLTQRLNSDSDDELGLMASQFDALLERVRFTIEEVSESSHQLNRESANLASIAKTSGGLASSQAIEIEQVAAAVHELSLTAKTVAESTSLAEDAAVEISEKVEQVEHMVGALRSQLLHATAESERAQTELKVLTKASDDIAKVLEVIHAVAEQTNLLALNAAIEAARAGEHGRGFAVVADEVRGLASRTQQSTTDINRLLKDLHAGVDAIAGVISEQAEASHANAQSVSEVVEMTAVVTVAVDNITSQNAQVASAAEEQNAVAGEISESLERVKAQGVETVQQVDETVHLSESLRQLINRVDKQLKQYKVK